jgi:hypothetical protein
MIPEFANQTHRPEFSNETTHRVSLVENAQDHASLVVSKLDPCHQIPPVKKHQTWLKEQKIVQTYNHDLARDVSKLPVDDFLAVVGVFFVDANDPIIDDFGPLFRVKTSPQNATPTTNSYLWQNTTKIHSFISSQHVQEQRTRLPKDPPSE